MIEGLMKLMQSNYSYPINIGNEEEVSILQLAQLIKSKINKEVIFVYEKSPLDDPQCRKPSLEKAKQYLDWNPKVSLSDGLNQTIDFFI